MLWLRGRRACSLVVVLALLTAGTLGGKTPAADCQQCPPGCPMHARRLACHKAGPKSCHRAPAVGLRSACSHASDPGAPTPVFRATIRPARATRPSFTASRFTLAPSTAPSAPLPEPPTDPPRAPVA